MLMCRCQYLQPIYYQKCEKTTTTTTAAEAAAATTTITTKKNKKKTNNKKNNNNKSNNNYNRSCTVSVTQRLDRQNKHYKELNFQQGIISTKIFCSFSIPDCVNYCNEIVHFQYWITTSLPPIVLRITSHQNHTMPNNNKNKHNWTRKTKAFNKT